VSRESTLFFLHGLGLGAGAATALAEELAGTADVVGIDLPGFGSAAGAGAGGVEDMVGWVEQRIGEHGSTRWGLIGHSMGGKIASIVADRAIAGASGLFGLRGIILLAASPLSPEPMDEQRRQQMLEWASSTAISAEHAATFIDANTAAGLSEAARQRAIDLVTTSSAAAWRGWLLRGSREDWSEQAGAVSPVPALIIAGAEDGDDLGAAAQARLNSPRFTDALGVEIPGSGHLVMIEQPELVAEHIRRFWTGFADTAPIVPEGTARAIASPRTSARTRGILAKRALSDSAGYRPMVLDERQLETLRMLAAHIVVQHDPPIDLAARVDRQLADGTGDGWRNADLPDDASAYRLGLDALSDWAQKPPVMREDDLRDLAAGRWSGGGLDGAHMAAWFEDARVDITRQWLAHPATMARIGFDGFANGGDGTRLQGFTDLRAGADETWEPRREGR